MPDGKGPIIKVEHGHTAFAQAFEYLALGFNNFLRAAEFADMRSPGIIQHGHLRFGQVNGVSDFANMVGAQLDHPSNMLRRQLQQGQRRTEVVIQVATGGQNRTLQALAQDAGEHFLDGGLAAGAGNRHHRRVERLTIERTQLTQGQTGIGDQQLRQRRTRHFTRHQRSHCAFAGDFSQVIMAIETRTGQGNKQLTRLNRPAVAAHSAECHVRTDHPGRQ